MRNLYKKFGLGLLLLVIGLSLNAQIHSTSAGGPWDDEDTWVGTTIPGSANDVVINGTVGCYSGSPACNNITISSSGVLQNDYYGGSLMVHGNLTNNGTIQNYSSAFTLYIKGNIINNGTWVNSYTRINGTAGQAVSCLGGHVFGGYQFIMEKASGSFFFDGDISFDNCEVLLDSYDVYLQPNSTLSIHDAQLNGCTLYGSGPTSVVNGIGAYNLDAPEFNYIDFNDVTLTGELNIYAGCTTHGSIISNATIRNSYYGATFTLYDDFINNGSIYDYSSGFTIRCYGNFTNNNVVDNNVFYFNGGLYQYVSLASGKTFSPSYFEVDKTSESVEALTNLSFDNSNVDLNGSILYMPNNSTFHMDGGRFGEGEIMALDPAESGNFTYNSINGATTDYITFHNVTLTGHFLCDNGNIFYGTTVNNALFENNFYTYYVNLYDHFINNGTIQNYSSYLYLNIHNDFTNNGIIENFAMDFYGTTDQNITLQSGKTFSPSYFTSLKPSGDIVALTDLYFDQVTINFNNDILYLQDGGLISVTGGRLHQVDLRDLNNTSGHLQLHLTDDAYIDYSTVYNPDLLGQVDIGSSNTFIGEILVTDTARNDYYGYTLVIDGNIVNNGIIKDYSSGFTINVNGNVTNNGIWQNQYTYLNGTTNQHVTCLNDNWFSGYQFLVSNSDAMIYFDDEVGFDNTDVLFAGNNAELPLNSTLLMHDCYLTECNLIGNGETSVMHGEGEFYVDGPYMQYTTLEDVTLTGDWGLGNEVVLNGTIINDGRIQNNYYSYPVEVYAEFINNGTVRNYSGYLTMKMYNNFTNNGFWDGHAIDLYGEFDQELTLSGELTFSPTFFTSFKPSGYIVAATDLIFDNTNVNLENDTLIMPDNSTLAIRGQRLYRANVSAETDRYYLELSDEAYLHECNLTDVDLIGITDISNSNNFYGNTINYGTMRNDYYTYAANFYGDLVNNGLIQSNSGSFIVNAYADIVNNGDWTTFYTQMVGTEDQTVTLKNGHSITGEMRFVSDVLASPYQWYWNTWPIENPPYPDPAIISGETSSTLTWISPVSSSWVGTYKCWAGGTYSRNIYIEECNSTMDIAPLVLDFGTYEVDPGSEVLSTFISNTGDCALFVEEIYLSGLQAPFSTDEDHIQNLTIAAGQSYEIPLTLNKDFLAGVFTDELYLSTFDMENIDIESGLVAYYPFDGNTNDMSGNNHHGTINGDPQLTTDRLGNSNSAYDFDGDGDFITAGDWFTYNDFSISLWVKQDAINETYVDIIDNNHTGSQNWAVQYSGLSDKYFFFTQPNGVTSFTLPNDIWKHLVFVKDGTSIKTYMNGVLQDEGITTSSINYVAQSLNIARWAGGGRCFDGIIDDVRIYDRGINVGEVNKLYYGDNLNPDIATVTVEAELTTTPEVAIKAFFEGPFNGTDMNTDLNTILPLDQPYNVYPWEYDGTESVTTIPNTDIVDWLLVEFRDAPDAASATFETSLGGQAAFILKDGSIVDLDGGSPVLLNYPITHELFIVLWHRNHLPVLSNFALTQGGGMYSYDFTTAATQAYGDNQSDLGGGVFGLIGGDANGDGTINEFDGIESWMPQVGQAGYLSGDVNMDGQVNNPDKNDTWFPNYGKSEILPGGTSSCGSALIDSRDGQSYSTLQIGTQCWMGENLNIGTRINGSSPSSNNSTIEKYCYNDQESNCDTDGGFYSWDEVMNWSGVEGSQGICPDNWHVPTHTEWCTMEQTLDPTVVCDNVAWRGTDIGTQLKAGGASGFDALLTGGRYWDGSFQNDNVYAYFWTSSATGTAISRHITATQPGVYRANNTKTFAFSVRCVED